MHNNDNVILQYMCYMIVIILVFDIVYVAIESTENKVLTNINMYYLYTWNN